MRPIDILRVLVAIAATGCASSERDDQPPRDTSRAPVAAVSPASWYQRARALDLTTDGRPDTVRLEAVGVRPDSLRITLSFIVDGEEKDREQWSSSDELTLLDSATRHGPNVDAVMRAQLDSVLASVVVQRFDAPGVRIMAEDTATLAQLDPRPTHRVSFSYGYETTVRLVWDAPRQRFVRLWTCC